MTSPIDQELADYQAEQVREYSKWQAAELILHDNVPAYNVGDPVPISNVEAHGYARSGKVLPQYAYVEDNPDDEDVKTFLAYVKAHPEHPAAKDWKYHQDLRAEEEARVKRTVPPLVFGGDADSAPGKTAKASPVKATAEKAAADKGGDNKG